MNDYITKPVSPQVLAETVEKWLPKETNVARVIHDEPMEPALPLISQTRLIWDRVGMLDRMMGDKELAGIIVKAFLSDIPGQIQTLRALLAREDAPGVRLQAHTIKGAAANIGAETLRSVASKMEKGAAEGDLDTVWGGIKELETQFERLRKETEKGL